jgi:hypothetical protein
MKAANIAYKFEAYKDKRGESRFSFKVPYGWKLTQFG